MSQNSQPINRQGMQQVVQDYLEALLTEPDEENTLTAEPVAADAAGQVQAPEPGSTTASAPEEQRPVASEPPQPAEAETMVTPEPVAAQLPVSEPPAAEPAAKPAPVAARSEAVIVAAPIAAEKLATNGNIRCMLVKMHGLNLAIPSDFVESVSALPNISLTLDAEHDWCLGSFENQGTTTLLIDTALWLIPQRYDPALAQYHELIILQGRHWALTCDELVKSIDIPVSAINWSAGDAERPWLWGTYMAERCALMNIQQLMQQFIQAM